MSRTARPARSGAPTGAVSDDRPSRPLARRILGRPWLWAVLLLGASVPLVMADPDVGFLAFLLALIGGWLCGAGFVGATLRMRSARLGALVHVLGAVLAGVLLWAMVSIGPAFAGILTGPARAAFVVAQFAAAPAAGWIWITLVGRAASRMSSRAQRADPPAGPVWEHEGRASILRFRAVPLRMRTLGLAIAAVVVVVGGIAATLLILTGDLAERLGPRLLIIVVGAGLALPASLLLRALLHRRTVECELWIGPDRLRLRAGGATFESSFGEIDLLRWRSDSDYARLEIRAAGRDLSLLAGPARVPKSTAPTLPPLPTTIARRLEARGLTSSRSRRGVTTFARESPT
ncbi:hypothetical protein [Herbiconiux sp. YIM B11900]|uniref:hypothetical protein n=1 Tax=Herbiconiux sp. YIM B11900 TaxID=3404131 RepID=UPI003F861942